MARPIWKGHLSFGLVSIPVGIYPAEKTDEMHFKMLDRRNLAPVRYQRLNEETGEDVPWGEIVKGYEYEEHQYVVLTEADFERADIKATQTVEILNFVDLGEIVPMYFDRPYYLMPMKHGEKGYTLLREALQASGKVGIAQVVLRERQHLAALMVHGRVLMLELLRYGHELREPEALDLPEDPQKLGIREKEVQMAEQLIEGMAEPWAPERYRDQYREDLMRMIRERVESGKTERVDTSPPGREKAEGAQVVDMLTLLKQSIAQQEQSRGAGNRTPSPTGKKASAASRRKSGPTKAAHEARKAEKVRKSA